MTLFQAPRLLVTSLILVATLFAPASRGDDQAKPDYRLSPGDTVRITAFQNSDLQFDAKVAPNGTIVYPLAGTIDVGGLTTAAAEQKLARLLKQSGIEIEPRQVSMAVVKPTEAPAAAPVVNDKGDYHLGPGDTIRISVFQNPDLSLESRVSDSGAITYPLIGSVELGGLSVVAAEQKLAKLLKDGGFVVDPQIAITLLQVRGSQVSLLGLVSRPGRYPLEQAKMKLTDVLALGGGIVAGAADSIVLVGTRDGKLMRKTVDITSMLLGGSAEDDVQVQSGDIVFVNKAAVFYISGEVQRPGSYRLERDMTLMQALVVGGGITQRGTERGIRVYRRDEKSGKVEQIELEMQDPVRSDDVISVRESLF
jgi:polysaccharide biosynthesis/export protein